MAKAKKTSRSQHNESAMLGYEAAQRSSMDAAQCKFVVLDLIVFKYISDIFEEPHAKLVADRKSGADPEDPDVYRAQSIFWVPPGARWQHRKAQARQPTIGQFVDDAMAGIERDIPALKGVLPKDYAQPALDKTRLDRLIDLISNIKVRGDGPGEGRPRHTLVTIGAYPISELVRGSIDGFRHGVRPNA